MKLPHLIVGVLALAGAAYFATADRSKTAVFSRAGAKSVSITPRKVERESKSVTEMVFDLAAWMAGADDKQNGDGLAALKARQKAEKKPMSTMSYQDISARARSAIERANSMGIATGPTAFDLDWQRQDDAMNPIKRLEK